MSDILYIHVPVAWLGLLGMLLMAGGGAVYLATRNIVWDAWSQAAAELGWLCCGLTLATGSVWGHAAWGTWWSWDPRLTSAFVLWMIYSGYLILRAQVDDPARRARLAAVFAILGALDVPLVIVAAYWFRGIHPAAVSMDRPIRTRLAVSVAAATVVFTLLLIARFRHLRRRFQEDRHSCLSQEDRHSCLSQEDRHSCLSENDRQECLSSYDAEEQSP